MENKTPEVPSYESDSSIEENIDEKTPKVKRK